MAYPNTTTSQWEQTTSITPGTAINLPSNKSRGVYVGVSGSVVVHPVANAVGVNQTFEGVAGTIIPVHIDAVIAAGTTAGALVGGQ